MSSAAHSTESVDSSRLEAPWLEWLAGALAVALACLPLLDLSRNFYTDWYNHSWQIAYYAEHLRRHFSLPVTLNTSVDSAMPHPVFYGYLFFPVAGLLAAATGPALALRLLIAGVLGLEYGLAVSTLKRLGARKSLAHAVAVTLIWALYPLTNVYNRAALPEFFAVGMLTCAVLLWFRLLADERPAPRPALLSGFGLVVTLAIGFHPITGLLGTLFLGLIATLTAAASRRWKLLGAAALLALPAAVALFPWLYATLKLQSGLLISTASWRWIYYPTIDRPLVRFYPFDMRIASGELRTISTPFLDATCNVALLLLSGALAVTIGRAVDLKSRNRAVIPIALFTLEFFFFFLAASLDDSVAELAPSFFAITQFGYRLVAYQDLALLCGLLGLLAWYRPRPARLKPLHLALCLLVASGYLFLKLDHAYTVANFHGSGPVKTEALGALPKTFNGFPDYEMLGLYPGLAATEGPRELATFQPGTGQRFGELSPVELTLRSESWVGTNLQVFPWTHVLLDGVEVTSDALRIHTVEHPELADGFLHDKHALLAVRAGPGKHRLEARVSPPALWSAMRPLALGFLAVWALGTLTALACRPARR